MTKPVTIIIVFFILFSMAPTMYEWNARGRIHPDRAFELVHNFPTDYNLYLSRVREGKEGAWLATEKYTSEPHVPSLSQVMYVAIGRLADFSRVQTPYVWFAYHTARVFFAAFLLWVIWKVVEWVIPAGGWQILTFLLVITQSTWPKFELVLGVPRLGGWMPWYTMADSLQRTTFMPHVLFAQALLIFILWVFSGGFVTKHTPGNFVFLGIVGLVLGIIFPPGLLLVYGVLGIVTAGECIRLWWKKGNIKKWCTDSVFGRIIFGIITAPSFVYFSLLLTQYPWKRLAEFDVLHPTKFSFIEYFMAVGPVLPLGLLGALFVLVKFGKLVKFDQLDKLKFFIAWVAAWLLFLFVFDKIPQQSPTRFTQMAPHVPLGILTAWVFYSLSKRMKASRILFIIPIVIILLGMGNMASSYMWLRDFVDHKLRATIPLVPEGAEVMYPMQEIIDGLTWLQVRTPRSAVVLAGMTTSNNIPVYSGNTAYVGHANTVNLEDKLISMERFYHRRLPLSWVKSQGIRYIFYSFEERDIAGGVEDLRTFYPELEQVYTSVNVRIYQVPGVK